MKKNNMFIVADGADQVLLRTREQLRNGATQIKLMGTDVLFDADLATKQGEQLSKMTKWYSPFEVLKMATSTNAELLALSGPRNPYQDGKLGVLGEGAYADMILVDGNPIQDIKLVENPERNFLIIMKDGMIYKNTLSNQ